MRLYYKIILFCIAFTAHYQSIIALPGKLFLNDTITVVRIKKIVIAGNKKTKEQIIRRELTFTEGQIFRLYELDEQIEKTREHLLKLPLFNFVTIDKEFVGADLINLYIIVEERWYIWPEIRIINYERNLNSWWETKDFSKLDYRISVLQYNVFGLNHKLRVGLSMGYTKEFFIKYQNLFLDKRQRHFLNVKAKVYYRDKQIYRTFQNKLETYVSKNDYAIQGSEFELIYNFRPLFYGNHFFSLAYLNQTVEDSLADLNPNFLGDSNTSLSFFQLRYKFTFDKRNSREYPTKGFLITAIIQQQGLGILHNNGFHKLSLYTHLKRFYHIGGKFYGANSFSLKKTFDNYEVYYFKRGLGYSDYLRGYEYYVIDGLDFALLKSNLKFNLLPRQIVNVRFLPLKKFRKIHFSIYLNTYFDIGYVYDKYQNDVYQNTLSNQLQYSGGIGLDFVTYYDKIIRFEYSIIKTGESGFFLHFMAPI
ncbi:MAG: hypothetical protein L3J74_10550 [Bacteroidales bacterium]|nr:hypothetical protein [Bacteroidales bacterium]